MICKIVMILSILSISAYRIESNEKLQIAISSESFRRDYLPLSYNFSDIRDRKHKKRSKLSESPMYPSIQYAPLPYEAKHKKHTVHENEENQNNFKPLAAPVHLLERGLHVYSTEAMLRKDHIEPRFEENNPREHKQRLRSNIPAYNFQLIPQPSSGYVQAGPFDAFLVHEDKIRKQETKLQHLAYYKKPKQLLEDNPTTSLVDEEQTTAFEIPILREILQKDNYAAFLPEESRVEQNTYSLHNKLAKEKRQQPYQLIPRLHLNTARIYNANTPKKVPLSPANEANALVKTKGLWTEYYQLVSADLQKTILHPVRS